MDLRQRIWILKSRNAGLDGWDMSYECRQREYPRLPLRGHLQAKEKGEDPKPPGGRQWKLNLVRWVCHGERLRQLRKTRPGGKETLLRPYAPLGAIRTNIYGSHARASVSSSPVRILAATSRVASSSSPISTLHFCTATFLFCQRAFALLTLCFLLSVTCNHLSIRLI